MILAIESCHKLGFIHRDIKPDVGVLRNYPHFYFIDQLIGSLTPPSDRTFCLLPTATSDSVILVLRKFLLTTDSQGNAATNASAAPPRTVRIFTGRTIHPVRLALVLIVALRI